MAAFSGSALYMEWVTSSGTTVLNTDFRQVNYSSQADLIDASAGADEFREYVSGMKDGDVTFSGVHQAAGTALWTAVSENTSGTIFIAPEGTTAGNEKITIPAIVQQVSRNQPYNDIVTLDVSWKQTAARTDGNY